MNKTIYALEVKNVNKYFHDEDKKRLMDMFVSPKKEDMFHSVKDVSFKVAKGGVFGVLGPNGCGKSTLIRMISTLVIPDDGTIKIYGVNVEQHPEKVKPLIGRVSVDASFFMKLSALENLDYAAGLYAMDRKQAREESMQILDELGFPKDKLNISVEKLSRGQQQKIAITRGFLAKPKLLLLDEPTTGLDPVSKLDVQKFIRRVIKDQDVTIVITSHDMEEIDKLCDELIIMSDGAAIAHGSTRKLKQEHCDKSLFEIETSNLVKTKRMLVGMPGVHDVRLYRDDKKQLRLTMRIDDIDETIGDIVKTMHISSVGFVRLAQVMPTLEDVFVKLTGKRLEEV